MDKFALTFGQYFGVPSDATATTVAHGPCPACGAPDLWVFKCSDAMEHFGKPTTCTCCGRSFKCFIAEIPGEGFDVDVVQTGGESHENVFTRLH